MKKILLLFIISLLFISCGDNKISVSMSELTGSKSKYYEGELFTGLALFYHENGSVREERNYVNGIREGSTNSYDKNGKLEAISNHHNNEFHGLQKLFHDNGKVKSKIKFSYGIMQNETSFDKNGIKRSSLNHMNGELEFAEIFHSNGQKVFELTTSTLSMNCWDIDGDQIKCNQRLTESYIRELMDM